MTTPRQNLIKLEPLVPERIIFAIDLTGEMDDTNLNKSNKGPTRMEHLKPAIMNFVESKLRMDSRHEFSICILSDLCIWYLDFTNDINTFKQQFYVLETQGDFSKFDMSTIYTTLSEKVPEIIEPFRGPPQRVHRLIMIYSRSNVTPVLESDPKISELYRDLENFYFDFIYIHKSKVETCQEVFDTLTDICESSRSNLYHFECSTKLSSLHTYMAHLLVHPLIRQPCTQAKLKQIL